MIFWERSKLSIIIPTEAYLLFWLLMVGLAMGGESDGCRFNPNIIEAEIHPKNINIRTNNNNFILKPCSCLSIVGLMVTTPRSFHDFNLVWIEISLDMIVADTSLVDNGFDGNRADTMFGCCLLLLYSSLPLRSGLQKWTELIEFLRFRHKMSDGYKSDIF